MEVYKYDVGEGVFIFELEDLLEVLSTELDNAFSGSLDFHVEKLEMSEEEYRALPNGEEDFR